MKLESNLRVFIAGKTQSGKTALTKFLLLMYCNALIYDIKREYGFLGAVVHDLNGLNQAFSDGCKKVVYQPLDISVDHFNEVCRFVWINLKNIVFVVDEVHKFCSKFKIPEFFNSIVTVMQGDPYRVGVIAISQRPANVHNDIISSSSIIISFRLNLKNDAEAMLGISADSIMGLKHHHFLVFDDRAESDSVKLFPPVKL